MKKFKKNTVFLALFCLLFQGFIFAKNLENKISDLQTIENFISKNDLAVLSYFNENTELPLSSLMTYAPKGKNLELYFMTFVESRLFENLQAGLNVSLVIGLDNLVTLQYSGIAHELKKKKEIAKAIKALKEVPEIEDSDLIDPRARFFKVAPTWVRHSDFKSCPSQVIELTLKKRKAKNHPTTNNYMCFE